MPVSKPNDQYNANKPLWESVRDCVEGSNKIKSKKSVYLPKPLGDDSSEAEERYEAYVKRANFVNFTGSTLDGMLGMVFRKPITYSLDSQVAYIEDNVNGAGLTLDQMSRGSISNMLQAGRNGFLVDFPQIEGEMSKAAESELDLKARILSYRPECVINWQTMVVNGRLMLSLVVLEEESQEETSDSFEYETKKTYRVLRLVDGVYQQEIWNDKDEMQSVFIPKKYDGSSWNMIPFIFAGATNNDPDVDKAPLYDIAQINISHYRNSADFEEASYLVGQPTPVIGGLSQSWVDKVLKDGVVLGSRRAVLLPEGGFAELLQASENSMPMEGMKEKEQQMIKIGARIIQDNTGSETAEAARIRFAGQNSKLGALVGNLEDALEICLEWVSMFMGGAGNNKIEINKEFYDKRIDPQAIIASIQLLDRGVIAVTDLRADLRKSGLIDREDEEIELESEQNMGDMGML